MVSLKSNQCIFRSRINFGESFCISEGGEQRPGLYATYEAAALAFDFTDDDLAEIRRGMNGPHELVVPMDVEHLAAYRHHSGGLARHLH